MNNKMEELLGMTKLADFLSKRADEEKKSRFLWIMAIIGAVAAIAVAAYFMKMTLKMILKKTSLMMTMKKSMRMKKKSNFSLDFSEKIVLA